MVLQADLDREIEDIKKKLNILNRDSLHDLEAKDKKILEKLDKDLKLEELKQKRFEREKEKKELKYLNKKEDKENGLIKQKYGIDILKIIADIEKEVSQIIVGQREIVRGVIRAILCNGHVLVEGVPGIAKTLLIKSIATVMGCQMNRIQFTVDLLPTDITGINSYDPKKGFEVIKGPIFANFIIADEINRSPPKTQSALLEAMEEKHVTIAKESYKLPEPFFVMATENPLENSGVYTLPEAQIDRFLFKLNMEYPNLQEELFILDRNVTLKKFEDYHLRSVLSPHLIIRLQDITKKIYISDEIKKYIVQIVEETRKKDTDFAKYIAYGASPRASIAIYIASKAEALMNGRDYVIPSDVAKVVYPILRHRIILNYEAEAEKIKTEDIIGKILNKVKTKEIK
jgi:MoxR-like ATPase